MNTNSVVHFMCWMMAMVLPLSLFAAERNAAMLTSQGVVKVNGSAFRGGAVYAGDQITTEPEASANLLSRGVSIAMPASSSIVYGTSQVEIGAGRVLVSATAASGMKGRIGKLTVTPSGRSARFQLASAEGTLSISALQGTVRVTDGLHSMLLPAGKMMTSSASPQGGAPAPAGATASGIPQWMVGLIVAGTFGSAIVGGIAATGGFEPASPSRPR